MEEVDPDVNSNIMKDVVKADEVKEEKNKCKNEEEESLGGPRFCPPLYIQRYGFIREILDRNKITSVVDFGCAECKILTLIKTVPSLENIFLVDIDEKLLQSRQYCIAPQLCDFLHRRDNPLHIQLLAGSAAIFDERILGVEAVTLIEVIEHLTDDILREVVENIFLKIRPHFIIITTPNADFNILFPNFTGFRHWDHKFEWSREVFEDWCNEIGRKYNYKVEITGVGNPPFESRQVGFCSQAAIFYSLATSRQTDVAALKHYKLISEYHYPYKEYKLTVEEELDNEVYYYIKCQCRLVLNDQDDSKLTIPVDDILSIRYVKKMDDPDLVRRYLENKFSLTSDQRSISIDINSYIDVQSSSSDGDDGEDQGDDPICSVIEDGERNPTEPEPDWD